MKSLTIGLAAIAGAVLASTPLAAQSLTISQVNATQPICVFDNACASVGTTTTANLQLYMQGEAGLLRTRTLPGLAGSRAAGTIAYEYQIDLTAVPVDGGSECIVGIVFGFNTITRTDYGHGPTDLYVISSGSQDTIAPSAANLIARGLVEVDFGAGVCAGHASEPFGLASSANNAPAAQADIRLLQPGAVPIIVVAGRAPIGAIGMSAPSAPTNLHVVNP